MDMDMDMDMDSPPAQPANKGKHISPSLSSSSKKSKTLAQTTLKPPPFAYAHLSLAQPPPPPPNNNNDNSSSSSSSSPPTWAFDALEVRAYLAAALRQFLGATGAAVGVDVLAVRGGSVWVRVPRADLGAFAAAVTAYPGSSSSSSSGVDPMVLQLRACGDWLGSLIGREEEAGLWN